MSGNEGTIDLEKLPEELRVPYLQARRRYDNNPNSSDGNRGAITMRLWQLEAIARRFLDMAEKNAETESARKEAEDVAVFHHKAQNVLHQKIIVLKEQNARQKTALEFYANEDNWERPDVNGPPETEPEPANIDMDFGETAREALKPEGGDDDE